MEPREPRRHDDATPRLVEEASRGDSGAVEELLARHLPGLRAYVRLHSGRLVRAKESCSDIAQSVCRELLENLEGFRYRGETAFRQWLYTAALHKIMDRARYYRAGKRDAAREVPLGATSPGDDTALLQCYLSFCSPSRALISEERIGRIEAAFDRLPKDYREAIVLSRVVGLSNREVAERMDRSAGAVANLIYRGLARLGGLLRDEG